MRNILWGLLIGVTMSACSTSPKQDDGFEIETDEQSAVRPQIKPSKSTSKAALSLLAKAREAAKTGQLDVAEANLERALRIEPRNAVLWHYMAKLRLYQKRLAEAAGLAAKSNSLEQQNKTLQADNWRIIAHARYQGGDKKGAQAAQAKVDKLSK